MKKLSLWIVALTLCSVAVSPVLAAKGSGGKGGGGKPSGGSGSMTVVMVNDLDSNGLPNRGDTIRFNVTTTATTEPHVSVNCQQNGVVVFGAETGYYDSYPWPWTQNISLSSMNWQSGAASCTATLYRVDGANAITITKMSFNVGE